MKRRLTIARSLDQPARAAAARRADDRARPAGPPRPVGPAVPAQAAGRHARAHHALHGRGRAALRPARRDGPGPDRRRGLAPPAHRRALDPRGRRAALHGRRAGRRCVDRARRHRPSGSRCSPTGVLLYTDDGDAAARRRSTTAGIAPESVLVRRSTLEDVFLHLTGRTPDRLSVDRHARARSASSETPRRRLPAHLPRQRCSRRSSTRSSSSRAMGLGLGIARRRAASGTGDLEGSTTSRSSRRACSPRTAMQTGAGRVAWPVMAGFKWTRSYDADARHAGRADRRRRAGTLGWVARPRAS